MSLSLSKSNQSFEQRIAGSKEYFSIGLAWRFFTLAGTGAGHIGRRYHGQRLVGAAVCVTSRSTVLVTMAVLYVGREAGEKLLTAWAGLFSFSIVAVTAFFCTQPRGSVRARV